MVAAAAVVGSYLKIVTQRALVGRHAHLSTPKCRYTCTVVRSDQTLIPTVVNDLLDCDRDTTEGNRMALEDPIAALRPIILTHKRAVEFLS